MRYPPDTVYQPMMFMQYIEIATLTLWDVFARGNRLFNRTLTVLI